MNLAEIPKKYRKYKVVLLLLAIFLLGFSIRYLARGPRIGPELDTWFHYRMVNYILDLGHIPKIDPFSYYPTGRPVFETDLLGLPTFIAYTYKIVGITGITLMDYMVAFPAIFTSLAAIPLYLLTKELLNEKAGLFTALFWQIIPSTLTRTHAGFVDKETLASVYIFLWLWLFLKSIRSVDISERKTLSTPILSGVFMGLGLWTWGGTEYFILVIATSVFLYTAFTLNNLNESRGYSIILMTVSGAMTLYIVQAPRFPLNLFYNSLIYTSLTLLSLMLGFLILYNYLKVHKGEKHARYVISVVVLIFLGGTFISGKPQSFFSLFIRFANNRVFLKKSLVGSTVSENLSPSFFCGDGSPIAQIMRCDWYSHFNVVLFIAPLGAILLLNRYRKKNDYASLFLLVFLVSGILGMRSDIRLSFVLTPSLAMLSAYFIIHFISSVQAKETELQDTLVRSKKHKARYKAESQLSNTKITKILVVVILFGIIASPTIASFSMLNGRKVDVPQPWYKAMIWINDNTPKDAVIVSWWDYGYWEQALGNRRTVVDGGNAGPLVYNTVYTEGLEYRGSTVHRDIDMAKMFTSSEVEALKYLRPYVDYEKVPTYVIVSYEEFGKSGAINHISQDGGLYIFPQGFEKSGDSEADSKTIMDFIINNGIEAYTVIDFGGSWQMWFTGFDPNKGAPDPEMKNKLLPKLLPLQNTGFGQGLEHFEPVYTDEWNYVFIYKVV
jgi:dolichyl-diphosphooligosaccharide--protein glycosyltransferase